MVKGYLYLGHENKTSIVIFLASIFEEYQGYYLITLWYNIMLPSVFYCIFSVTNKSSQDLVVGHSIE